MAQPWVVDRPEKPRVTITVYDEEQLALATKIKEAYESKRYIDLVRITMALPKELQSPVFQRQSNHILTVDVIKEF